VLTRDIGPDIKHGIAHIAKIIKTDAYAIKCQASVPSLFVAFTCIFVLASQGGNFPLPSGDEAVWHYIGYAWSYWGVLPYTGTIDNKGMGIYSLYALTSLIFGVNFTAAKVVGALCTLTTAIFIYRFVSGELGRKAGIFAATLYLLTSAWSIVGCA